MSLAHQPNSSTLVAEISATLDKNDAIARHGSGPENSSALDCQAGRELYFGSSIGLRSAAHGGFLCFDSDDSVQASAASMTPLARFVVLNAENLQDNALLRYGDAILLQVGEYEVLGVKYRVVNSGDLVPYLAVINSRGDNLKKATTFGRWIIMNQRDSIGSMGSIVGHLDAILLEKEWGFLSSFHSEEAGLLYVGSFEDVKVEPKVDSTWIVHMIPLAGINDMIDFKHLNRGLLTSATNQLDKSAEGRRQANQMLKYMQGKFYRLKSRELDKSESEASPRRLQKLKKVRAKIKNFERPISPSPNLMSRLQCVEVRSDALKSISPLADATASYNECAAPLMRSCKEWSCNDSSLSKYFGTNPTLRSTAARKIQRWFQKYVLKFSFFRALEQRKRMLEIRAMKTIGSTLSDAEKDEYPISNSSRSVEMDAVSWFSEGRLMSSIKRRTTLQSLAPRKVNTLCDQKKDQKMHFSRRKIVGVFSEPASYREVKVLSIQKAKHDIKDGLKILQTTYDKRPLFEDLLLVKLRKK